MSNVKTNIPVSDYLDAFLQNIVGQGLGVEFAHSNFGRAKDGR
jgi:hypothetical protein